MAYFQTVGKDGKSAGFGTPTASVDNNTGVPSVEVTASGDDTKKVFNFKFHNLKGEKGNNSNISVVGESLIFE